MEEKMPLESRLTHTSKEPEAQAWAQIGTKSYDSPMTLTPSNESIAMPQVEENGVDTNELPEENNSSPQEEVQEEEEEEKGSEIALAETACADTGAESENSDDTAAVETNPQKKQNDLKEQRKKNTLSDGFEATTEPCPHRTRDRSRSRERRRERSPDKRGKREREEDIKKYPSYRTNSKNVDDLRARVFIGHLNTDECDESDVETVFKPYGKIMGVTLQNGYGFVQYNSEKSVLEAIKNIHGTSFRNMKLVVDRPVALRRLEASSTSSSSSSSSSRSRDSSGSKSLMEELEYLRRREFERNSRYDRMDKYYYADRRDWDKYYRSGPMPPPVPPPLPPSPFLGEYPDRGDHYGDHYGGDRYGGRAEASYDRYGGGVGGGAARYRDDGYREDRYREPPYDYDHRGGPYGDQYSRPSRRI